MTRRPPAPDLARIARLALSRRGFLIGAVGVGAGLALAGCAPSPRFLTATDPAIAAAEARRATTGATVTAKLTAAPTTLDLAGRTAPTWAYGGIPAPVIRANAGDRIRATLDNRLPEATSIHWHGVALRNDMDGVPPVTQDAVGAGDTFAYDFIAEDPGTYFFHPHVGVQIDRGLYGALIVDDPHEPLHYDDEWVIILDDWLDGVTTTPDEVLQELSAGMGSMGNMGGMSGMGGVGGMMGGSGTSGATRSGNMLMGTSSALLGGDAGDVYYPDYLVNGKPKTDPAVFTGTPGSRVRIRLINAGSDTAFRVALGSHQLTVTHTDGYPVQPVEVDSVLIGMGERYDVLVTLGDGAFPLVAQAEGKNDRAFAIVRTGGGAAPSPDVQLSELSSTRIATVSVLAAAADAALSSKTVDRSTSLSLTGGMMSYDWGIDGRRFDASKPLDGAQEVRQGERVRLTVQNQTMMWHPFHLHGHTFQLAGGGPRKDTAIVLPGKSLIIDFDANNPGVWAAHCHNIYHAESGMMTMVGYTA